MSTAGLTDEPVSSMMSALTTFFSPVKTSTSTSVTAAPQMS
jgi:hypothetical protein